MSICVIIPARFNSKRLPRKPLIKINGQELLLRTYKRVIKLIDKKDVYIFSDNLVVNKKLEKIKNIIYFKGNFLNGTERVSFGLKKIKKKYSAVLIVSCDNPFMSLNSISQCLKSFREIKNNKEYFGSTVHVKNENITAINRSSIAKVVINKKNDIMYISRAKIPFKSNYALTHHGPVCIKTSILKKYNSMKNSYLQNCEDNEWLKLLEDGYKLRSKEIKSIMPEVNTKHDLNYYIKYFKENEK